jgi:hypothetical protein
MGDTPRTPAYGKRGGTWVGGDEADALGGGEWRRLGFEAKGGRTGLEVNGQG